MENFVDFKTAQALAPLYLPAEDVVKKVVWLFGETGTGKTRIAYELGRLVSERPWTNSNDLKWFDGYTGQTVAILDDFRETSCDFTFLLRLCDRYPLSVPVKGSFTPWTPTIIFITCPYSPDDLYRGSSEKLDQLKRRLFRIAEVTNYEESLEEIKNVLDIWLCSFNKKIL